MNNDQFVCERLLEMYGEKSVENRTRYECVIENLEAVFDIKNICYELSEHLYSQEGLNRIASHLGISDLVIDANSPNPSPKMTSIPDHIKREVIKYYKNTYQSVFQKFGDTPRALWGESYNLPE